MSASDERLASFVRSLNRYAGMLGLKINIELAKKVEEVQLKIMDDVARTLNEMWNGNLSLQDLLAKLAETGLLKNLITFAASSIGEHVEPEKAEEALSRAISGDLSESGSKGALLAFQAIARSYAEKFAEARGSIQEVTAFCPLCGSESRTMVKRGNSFFMVCHLCGYAWKVSEGSAVCPFCGNDNKFKIGTFMDKEMRYGLMYCQECGSSWRVILDENMAAAPNIIIPLLAMGAERFRSALPSNVS